MQALYVTEIMSGHFTFTGYLGDGIQASNEFLEIPNTFSNEHCPIKLTEMGAVFSQCTAGVAASAHST